MYTSFYHANEGDTTFLTDDNWQNLHIKLTYCAASKLFIHKSVYDLLDDMEKERINKELIPCDNPKLEFMKEVAEQYPHGTRPCIRHNGEQIDGPVHMVEDNIHIGVEPLNVERDENGELHDFTYLGGVQIGKNVQIGSNSTIARGALDDTIIEDNVRMDCNVFVGNGALIGAGSIICVGVIIGGGVKIGKNSFIGLGAIINNHIRVNDSTIVGSGAVVTTNTFAGSTVVGIPARKIEDNLTDKQRYKMVSI